MPRRALADGSKFAEALPALVWIADFAVTEIFFNAAWCAYTGLAPAQLEAIDSIELVHPADRAATQARFARARDDGRAFSLEYRLRAGNGEMRWHLLNVKPHALGGGESGWIGIAIDIDERRREAELLRFLSGAGEAFFSANDVSQALERVARLAVPAVADWCAVYAVGKSGALVPLAVVHEDAERARASLPVFEAFAGDARRGAARALVAQAPLALSRDDDPLHAHLDATESLLVPLSGRDDRFGVMHFIAGRAGGAFARLDFAAARELAARATAAYDEATLFASQQRAAADLRFLAEVGEAMGESLDLQERLGKFVRGVVPRLADWATVNLLDADGALETVAIAHRDPHKAEIAERLYGPYYGTTDSYTGTPVALREQRSILLRGVDESVLRVHIRPETYDDVLALGADSAFIVPLVADGHAYGTLSAMRSEREHPFLQGEMWLIEELARRAAVAIHNARLIERDRTVSDAFQRASLPAKLPHTPGFRFDAFYAPGRFEAKIGGDWYDAFELADGRVVVTVGDVAGSGLQAAVIMNGVRQVLRGVAQLEPDPAIMLDATDRALRGEHPDTVVTALVGVIDPALGTFAVASAGHPPPVVRRGDGRVEMLALAGLPLGLREPGDEFVAVTSLAPGDAIVLYTDGLIESTRDIVEGERRLLAAVERLEDPSAAGIAAALVDSILFDGSFDDVAILTIVVETAHVRRFDSADGAAAHRALDAFVAELRGAGAGLDAVEGAALVFLELVGNAVRHAPGPVETRLTWPDGWATLDVVDEGAGFTPAFDVGPPADPLAESGRGLFLAASIARELRYERRPRGMRARAVFDIRAHAARS